MKISPVNYSPLCFKSKVRSVYSDGQAQWQENYISNGATKLYSNYTIFFREDLNDVSLRKRGKVRYTWDNFLKTAIEHFKDAPMVNTFDFGCSDGSEAYSLISGLIKNSNSNEAKKFFPVMAYDIDEYIISCAKNGEIEATYNDIDTIQDNLENYRLYFQKARNKEKSLNIFPYVIMPNDTIKRYVRFNVGDFCEKLDNVPKSNSLVLCRNFWPYMKMEDREIALNKLQNLDSSSLVVIGGYDDKAMIEEKLIARGFIKVAPCTFKKQDV